MADFDWLGAGVKVLGGLLGANDASNGTTKTSQTSMDPRFDPFIWGDSKTTGIVPQAYANYSANPSGMNQQMADGLNRQWNTFSDPDTAQGYTNMQGLGASLMGAPISGNPFSDGRIALASGTGAGQVGQSSFGQQAYNNPATQAGQNPFSVTQPVKAPAPVSGGLLGSVVPAQTPAAIGAAQGDGQGAGPSGVGNGATSGGGYNTGNDAQQGTNDNSVAGMHASNALSSLGDMAKANMPALAGFVTSALAGPALGMVARIGIAQLQAAIAANDLPKAQELAASLSGQAGGPGGTAASDQALGWGMGDMFGGWGYGGSNGTSDGFGRGGGFGRGNSAGDASSSSNGNASA